MVIGWLPSTAVTDAVRVSPLWEPVVEFGLKLAVTPSGKPLAVSTTEPAKRLTRRIVTVSKILIPRSIVKFSDVKTENGKGSGAIIGIRIDDDLVLPAADATAVRVCRKGEAGWSGAVMVAVLVVPVIGLGLNVADQPGSGDKLSAIGPVNPGARVTNTVVVPLVPARSCTTVGRA